MTQHVEHPQHIVRHKVPIYFENFQKSSTIKLEESNVSPKSKASELGVVAVKGELAAELESEVASGPSLADRLLARLALLFSKPIQPTPLVEPV